LLIWLFAVFLNWIAKIQFLIEYRGRIGGFEIVAKRKCERCANIAAILST